MVTQMSYLAMLHEYGPQHLVCFCSTGLTLDATNTRRIIQGMKIKIALLCG
jgi:hypothetical protein